jgi:SNF2 family DNA or RNA helicase
MKKRSIDLKQATAHFIHAVRDLNVNTESSGKAMSLPRWASIDENAMDTREYAEAMTTWLLEGGFQGLRKLSMSELSRQMDDMNMEGMGDVEGMEGMEDIDDDTAEFQQPDAPNSPCIEARDDKTKKNKKAKGSENLAKHRLFLGRIGKMKDIDVFTPRCKALMELYMDIQKRYPGEKVMIWSRFYKSLVIIAGAMCHRYEINVPIFTRLLDTEQRDNMLYTWQGSYISSKVPIRFQAKAGDTGLMLDAASHVIFFKP